MPLISYHWTLHVSQMRFTPNSCRSPHAVAPSARRQFVVAQVLIKPGEEHEAGVYHQLLRIWYKSSLAWCSGPWATPTNDPIHHLATHLTCPRSNQTRRSRIRTGLLRKVTRTLTS